MIYSKFDELQKYIMHYLVANKLAHFQKGLRSKAIIQVKEKKLAENNNSFSSIFMTSVILSSVLKIGQMLKTSI